MDIMELGAIGELVGGVAVIGSLIYVGLQIRHNTRVLRGQAMTGLLVGESSAETAFMGADTSAAFVKACESPADLTGEEIAKLWAYLNVVTMAGQHMHQMHALGLASDDDRDAAVTSVANWLGFPFGGVWWNEVKEKLPRVFVGEIETGLAADPSSLLRQYEGMKQGVRALAAAVPSGEEA